MKLLFFLLVVAVLVAFDQPPKSWEGRWKCREGRYSGITGEGYDADLEVEVQLTVIAGDSVLVLTNSHRILAFSLKHAVNIDSRDGSRTVGYYGVEKIAGRGKCRISLYYDEWERLLFVNLITDSFMYSMKMIHLEKRML